MNEEDISPKKALTSFMRVIGLIVGVVAGFFAPLFITRTAWLGVVLLATSTAILAYQVWSNPDPDTRFGKANKWTRIALLVALFLACTYAII